jgi:hypothetical protein
MVFKQKGAVDEVYVVEGIVSFYLAGSVNCELRKPGMLSMFTTVYELVLTFRFVYLRHMFPPQNEKNLFFLFFVFLQLS